MVCCVGHATMLLDRASVCDGCTDPSWRGWGIVEEHWSGLGVGREWAADVDFFESGEEGGKVDTIEEEDGGCDTWS
jgi:hypothetical protein